MKKYLKTFLPVAVLLGALFSGCGDSGSSSSSDSTTVTSTLSSSSSSLATTESLNEDSNILINNNEMEYLGKETIDGVELHASKDSLSELKELGVTDLELNYYYDDSGNIMYMKIK